MYESPKLVPMNGINSAYGHGQSSMGLCVVNVNLVANVNVGALANVLIGVLAPAFAVVCVAAMTCANAVAVALVVNHYSPIGAIDPRLLDVPEPSDGGTKSLGE